MTIAAKPSNQLLEPAARGQTQAQVVWAQFKKHQLAIFGALILGVLYLGAIFAPFIAPYGMAEYSTTDITKYHPPTTVYFHDPESGRLEFPFVYASKRTINQESFQTTYLEDRSTK
jgi:peptide/nickel transport system permease protein